MKKQLFNAFLVLSLFCVDGTAETFPTESEISQWPEDLQRVSKFLDYVKKDLGYAGTKVLGFDIGKTQALTSLVITKEKYDFIRIAEVGEGKKGANIFFRTDRSCTVISGDVEKNIIDKIITVDGQRIQTAYVCAKRPEDPSETQEIYVTKTPEGQQFIQQKFLTKNFVFVGLGDDLEVPFSTKGFSELWNRANQPAL